MKEISHWRKRVGGVHEKYSHLFLAITSWLKSGKNEELGSLWGKGTWKICPWLMCYLSHLKAFKAAWHHLVFTQTTGHGQGGPWVLWTFQNTDWKKKAEVWGRKHTILFSGYVANEDNGILTWGWGWWGWILYKMPRLLTAICHWFRNSFVLWRIWLFLFSLLFTSLNSGFLEN